MTSNLNANSTTTIASPNCPPPPPSVCSPNQVESPEDIPVPDPSQTAIANNSNIEQQQYNNTAKQHF
ncbi:unnamed protein product [Anisakis simplex]|uniref:Uncharacterized protein n=1 Tax=Anisakis simplex TaxID=6269 RepID=A0A0M3JLL3_ANISI|nr:unnamed protein product [Anisakis simplex]VDK39980.1 unnamed protein product [Anisakis simplex]